MTHPKLCIMFPFSQVIRQKFCYCHTLASGSFYSGSAVLPSLRRGASYSISWRLCVTLRLDNSPSHTHKHTHTTHKGRKNENAVINHLRGNACGWGRPVECYKSRGHRTVGSESTIWQASRRRADWLVDWLAYRLREVPNSDEGWKPSFKRSRCRSTVCFNSETHLDKSVLTQRE